MNIVDTNYTQFFIDGKKYAVDFTNLVCSFKEYPFDDIDPEKRMKWMETARKQQVDIYCIPGGMEEGSVFLKTVQELSGMSADVWAADFNNIASLKTEIIPRDEAIEIMNNHGSSIREENYHLVFPEYNDKE